MSAKITINTEDDALSALLAILVAKAIQDAGFNNTLAKTVMISAPVPPVGFNRVSTVAGEIDPHYLKACECGERMAPELKELRYFCPPDNGAWMKDMVARNPGILEKPILLDYLPDTSREYELRSELFLLTGKHYS